jgi:hypothetical protein
LQPGHIFVGHPHEFWHFGRGDRASAVFSGSDAYYDMVSLEELEKDIQHVSALPISDKADKTSSAGQAIMHLDEARENGIAEQIYNYFKQVYAARNAHINPYGAYITDTYSKDNVASREIFASNPWFYPVTFARGFLQFVDSSTDPKQQRRIFDSVLNMMGQASWQDIFWEFYQEYRQTKNEQIFYRNTDNLQAKLNSLQPIYIDTLLGDFNYGNRHEQATGVLEILAHSQNEPVYGDQQLADFRNAQALRNSWLEKGVPIYESRDSFIKAIKEVHAQAAGSLQGADIVNGLSQHRAGDVTNPDRPLEFPHTAALDSLMAFLAYRIKHNDDFLSQHPIVQASDIFLRIMDMQYFVDGNRRVARLMANYHLMLNGYPKMFVDDPQEYINIIRFMRTPEELADFIADGYLARYRNGKWDITQLLSLQKPKLLSQGSFILQETLQNDIRETAAYCTQLANDPLQRIGRGRITFITNARSFTQEDKDFLDQFASGRINMITIDDESKDNLYNTGFRGNIAVLDDYRDSPESLWVGMPQEDKIARVAANIRGQNTAVITVTNNTIAQKIPDRLKQYMQYANDRQKGTIIVASMQGSQAETRIGDYTIREGDILFSIAASYAVFKAQEALQGAVIADQTIILDILPPIDSQAFEKFIHNLLDFKRSQHAAAIAA